MRRLTLNLELLTPLFLAGADQGEAELRPPSVRGLLRYWFRAMMGGIVGPQEVYKVESEVFGSTDRASRILVRIGDGLKERAFDPKSPGLRYLFFSMSMQHRQCIPAGKSFRITLQERSSPDGLGEEVMGAAVGSLWLLTHLGGLGSRSRRGGGNLRVPSGKVKVTNISPEGPLGSLIKALLVKASSIHELKSHLESGLEKVKKEFEKLTQFRSRPSGNPRYTIIHPEFLELWLLKKTWQSWEEALEEVGRAYRDFRNRRDPDYGNVKSFLRGQAGAPQTIERAAFGLPLRFYYRSLRGASATLRGREHERRASPLGFRLLRLADGKYAILVSFSKVEFLPQGEELQIRGESCAQPSLSIVKEFIQQLSQQMGKVRV